MILRAVSTSSQLKEAFKEAAKTVLEEGALLRRFQNLGERQLPFRIRAHEDWHKTGRCVYTVTSHHELKLRLEQHSTYNWFIFCNRYIVCDMEASPAMSKTILEKMRNNSSTIRASMMKI